MRKYIVKRIIWLFPILFLISFVSFSLMFLSPGDPIEIMLRATGDPLDGDLIAALREKYKLNDPFLVQYFRWIGNLLHGDLGTSYRSGLPVTVEFAKSFPYTVRLAVISLVGSLALSLVFGIWAAVRENHLIDYAVRFATYVTTSLPSFYVALLLIIVLAVNMHLLPTISARNAQGIIIPTLTLIISMSANYTRQIRAAIIKELGEPYSIMGRTRGVREMYIVMGAIKSAMPTILTISGMNFGWLLGGTVIIEVVCSYPGIGNMAMDAISCRDYPMIQAYVLLMAAIYVVINLLVDILHAYSDKRVKNELTS